MVVHERDQIALSLFSVAEHPGAVHDVGLPYLVRQFGFPFPAIHRGGLRGLHKIVGVQEAIYGGLVQIRSGRDKSARVHPFDDLRHGESGNALPQIDQRRTRLVVQGAAFALVAPVRGHQRIYVASALFVLSNPAPQRRFPDPGLFRIGNVPLECALLPDQPLSFLPAHGATVDKVAYDPESENRDLLFPVFLH